jgi:plastocyanin
MFPIPRAIMSVLVGLALAAPAWAETVVVTQRGRAFTPSSVEIGVGDTVRIVNDDGDLLHHAYLDAPGFAFDIGEQEPGQSNEIVFPVAGTFDVFCGIHPKMKLTVTAK